MSLRSQCIHSLTAAALLSGCASMAPSVLTQRPLFPSSPQSATIRWPESNTEAKAELGDSMITVVKAYSRPAIRLLKTIIHRGTSRGQFEIEITAGELIASGVSSGPVRGTFFEAQQPLRFNAYGGSTFVKGGIFVPDTAGHPTEVFWHATDTGIPLVDPEPAAQFERTTHEEWQPDSFRRELIYNGRTGNTVKLLYREFNEEMIRPAFTQEVAYDLDQGQTIGFKGARFQVVAADNVNITYTVLHHFD